MNILSLATHSDWFFHFGAFGNEGIQRMCDLVSEAGVSRLYLRSHDGGMANYPTQKGTPLVGEEVVKHTGQFASFPKAYHNYVRLLDYRKWDPIDDFLQAAPHANLEPGIWYTVMEDDHGGHVKSEQLKAHPEWRCVNRKGDPIEGCLEFAFKEVRDYKLAILDELLEKGSRHILLDLVRRNGKPSADADGLYQYGFNPELIAAFQEQGGKDPRHITPGDPDWQKWLDFVSEPYTEFFTEALRRIHAKGASAELLTWPVHLKNWMGIDLEKILDAAPVEAIHVASHTYSYSPAELDRQLNALRPQIGDRPVQIVPSISGYTGLAAAGLDTFFAAAADRGVESIVVHESDALFRNRVGTRFRALAFGAPHYKRALHSRQAARIDWSAAKKLSGFLRGYNETSIETDQLTEIQVAHTADELAIRITCHERDVAGLIPVPRWPADNYNVNQLGPRLWWNPKESVHLFLSTPGQYGDYFHFLLDPADGSGQERRLDEAWSGPWSHEVDLQKSAWVATFRIPFTTLDFRPKPGQKIAIHAVRAQSRPTQITLLNLAGTNVINPDEFGFLHLD
jgi:hypothetical protein